MNKLKCPSTYVAMAITLFLSQTPLGAAESMSELESRINMLADEIEILKSADTNKTEKVHLFGYGEMHYNNNAGNDGLKSNPSKDVLDFHRFVLGMAVDFSDNIKFSSELDFENGFKSPYIEYAYMDFLISDQINIRAGSMMTPVGYINETHEPPTFYSVERPYVDRLIVPTTWPEGGVGIFGNVSNGLSYKLYLQSSLGSTDAANGKFFQAKNGIRKGRYKAAKALANDIAVVGRIEYTGQPGLNLGVSLYVGDSAQNIDGVGNGKVTLWDVDARYRVENFEFRGMYAKYTVADSDLINIKNGNTTGDGIGSVGIGWRAELSYHLGDLLSSNNENSNAHEENWFHPSALQSWQVPTQYDLVPFIRYETINTQAEMALGQISDPKYDRKVVTIGAAFLPSENTVVKADLENWTSGNTVYNYKQFNLGIGYMF